MAQPQVQVVRRERLRAAVHEMVRASQAELRPWASMSATRTSRQFCDVCSPWRREAFRLGNSDGIAILLFLAQLESVADSSLSDQSLDEFIVGAENLIAAWMSQLLNSTLVAALYLGACSFVYPGDLVGVDVEGAPVQGDVIFHVHFGLTVITVISCSLNVLAGMNAYQVLVLHLPDVESRIRFLRRYRLRVGLLTTGTFRLCTFTYLLSLMTGAYTVSRRLGDIYQVIFLALLITFGCVSSGVRSHVLAQQHHLVAEVFEDAPLLSTRPPFQPSSAGAPSAAGADTLESSPQRASNASYESRDSCRSVSARRSNHASFRSTPSVTDLHGVHFQPVGANTDSHLSSIGKEQASRATVSSVIYRGI